MNNLISRLKIGNSNAKDFPFINPQGKPVLIHNLRKYCREHNLNVGNMWAVFKGIYKTSKGWTCQRA